MSASDANEELVTVATDVPKVRLPIASSILESAGIEFFVENEVAATSSIGAVGGATIRVRAKDAAKANELLREVPEEIESVPELDDEDGPSPVPVPVAQIATPVDREPFADALRGFALIGMVIANAPGFALSDGAWITASKAPNEKLLYEATLLLVGWKFFPIFSMLFGFGLAEGAARSSARPWRAHARMFWLAIIGGLHVVFAWSTDILLDYAVLGTIALFLVRRPTFDLFLIGAFGLLLPYVIMIAGEGFQDSWLWEPTDEASIAKTTAIYATGDFASVARLRVTEFVRSEFSLMIGTGIAFAMMLLGMVAARRSWFRAPNPVLCRWTLFVCLPAGLALNYVTLHNARQGADFRWDGMFHWFIVLFPTMTLGSIALSLSYVAALALAWRTSVGRFVLRALVPAGRASLTIYISHSVVLSLVFCGYGLGWYDQLGLREVTAFAIAVLTAQMILAALWLRRFERGPIEAALRRLTV